MTWMFLLPGLQRWTLLGSGLIQVSCNGLPGSGGVKADCNAGVDAGLCCPADELWYGLSSSSSEEEGSL